MRRRPGDPRVRRTPLAISLVLAALLHRKASTPQPSSGSSNVGPRDAELCYLPARHAVEGIVMVPEIALTVCAVATTPFPPDPADPLADPGRRSL